MQDKFECYCTVGPIFLYDKPVINFIFNFTVFANNIAYVLDFLQIKQPAIWATANTT